MAKIFSEPIEGTLAKRISVKSSSLGYILTWTRTLFFTWVQHKYMLKFFLKIK